MKANLDTGRDSVVFVVSLLPLPAAVVLLFWPALGVSFIVGNSCLTASLIFSLLGQTPEGDAAP